MNPKSVLELIEQERNEQVSKYGFTAEHDDQYLNEELKQAARFCITLKAEDWPIGWDIGFKNKILKKNESQRLIISASFLVAEIERIGRTLKYEDTNIPYAKNSVGYFLYNWEHPYAHAVLDYAISMEIDNTLVTNMHHTLQAVAKRAEDINHEFSFKLRTLSSAYLSGLLGDLDNQYKFLDKHLDKVKKLQKDYALANIEKMVNDLCTTTCTTNLPAQIKDAISDYKKILKQDQ